MVSNWLAFASRSGTLSAYLRVSTRTIPKYLLSPAHKAWHEAGRKR